MVGRALRPTLARAPPHGPARRAQHVSCLTHPSIVLCNSRIFPCSGLFTNLLERWNLYCAEHLLLHCFMDRCHLHNSSVPLLQSLDESHSFLIVAICTPTCSNGGTCSSPGVCTCPSTWTGTRCTTRELSPYLVRVFSTSLFQRFVHRYAPTVERVPHPTLAVVSRDGLELPVEHVSYTILSSELHHKPIFFLVVCTSACLNGGTCTGPNTCTCVSGWSGATCGTCT